MDQVGNPSHVGAVELERREAGSVEQGHESSLAEHLHPCQEELDIDMADAGCHRDGIEADLGG